MSTQPIDTPEGRHAVSFRACPGGPLYDPDVTARTRVGVVTALTRPATPARPCAAAVAGGPRPGRVVR